MSFSINTNIASLEAQQSLQNSSTFQSKTINQVTSGLRIVNSGDDAAGLAIANGLRSDEAVLTQGIQNANNGLSTLQTMDGGMSNISTLLDRARTLATQAASGTFSGNRSTLNDEFQSVMTEIDRQAQSIGLNQGGQYAADLSVFVGGGRTSGNTTAISNGSIDLNLSGSAVDTKSLGLKGFTAGYQVASGATDSGLYDLGNSSATSVKNIMASTGATTTSFVFSGAGFSGSTNTANAPITVNVNLANVSDTASLVTAINNGIASAAATGSPQANAFKAAGITASIHTGIDGHQQLLFTSSTNAFQVEAGDTTANGFLGNLGTNTGGSATNATATPEALSDTSDFQSGGAAQLSVNYGHTAGLLKATPETQTLTLTAYDASGNPFSTKITLDSSTAAGANLTAAEAVAQINQQLQATDNPALMNVVASASQAGDKISFSSNGTRFDMGIGVAANGDGITYGTSNVQGVIETGTTTGVGANQDISTQAGAESAVTALATAVQKLGTAQAAVGKGENNLNYAINLAQSQNTNEAAAESGIRDANLAQEAANLTKAQILVQAGTAALAQANSAPQQLLSLLQGR